MAFLFNDRVKETSTSTGLSDFALSGAVTGFQSFSAGIGANNTCYYAVTDGTDWEVGLGTVSSDGLTLARTTILQSSSSDSKVNFGSGEKTVFCTYPASKAVDTDNAQTLTAKTLVNSPSIDFDTTAGVTVSQGQMAWNADEETLDLGLNGAVLQLGQEIHYHVRNNTGSSIPNGTPVMATGTLGASGRITIAPMDGTDFNNAKYFLGITTEAIGVDEDGKVTHFGKVRGINTSSYTAGSVLWISTSTVGALTDTEPTTGMKLPVAFVINSNNSAGTIFVRATTGSALAETNDIDFNSLGNNHILVYNSTSGVWENKSPADARTALGLVIGTDVQPYDADLTSWAAIAPSTKQDTLVSGTNIKTVNSNSLLGSGNISVGTVTSVAASAGTGISISGSPITASGTLTITNTAPDQTVVLTAGTGISTSGTYPNFTVTNSDRGSSQNIFKNIAVSGQSTVIADSNDDTLNIANGTGISVTTNATTDTLTITNTAPDQTVALTAGTGISVTGTYPSFTITNTAASTGDVTGPASSTDNAIPRFNGTGGKTLKNSGITIDDNNNLILAAALDEKVYYLPATNPALSPANGTIQSWPLAYSSTPTLGTWNDGESLTLMVGQSPFFTVGSNDSNDSTIGATAFPWASGAFDPATFTFSTTDNVAYSYAAATVALRPASGQTISFVGGKTASTVGTTSTWNTSLTDLNNGSTLQENDIVVVYYGVSSTTDVDLSATGYTELADLYISDTYDANLFVGYKIMGSTPDTTITFSQTGSADNAGAASILVFRNVNTTTPIDVTTTTATAANTVLANPPAITPTTAGAWIIYGASGAHNAGTQTYGIGPFTITFPTITWINGSAPALSATQQTVIELWKVNNVVYGAFVGYA